MADNAAFTNMRSLMTALAKAMNLVSADIEQVIGYSQCSWAETVACAIEEGATPKPHAIWRSARAKAC